jgi:hypothetical protein
MLLLLVQFQMLCNPACNKTTLDQAAPEIKENSLPNASFRHLESNCREQQGKS